ncbi:organic solute transporter alpha-like protein, partial [Gryllus bimaculatus]
MCCDGEQVDDVVPCVVTTASYCAFCVVAMASYLLPGVCVCELRLPSLSHKQCPVTQQRGDVVWRGGVAQVVAMASYCAVIVPRAQLLAEAVTQGAFTAAVYQLFCLLLAYAGGTGEATRAAKRGALDTRVGPCCCWPCCCCLPQLDFH